MYVTIVKDRFHGALIRYTPIYHTCEFHHFLIKMDDQTRFFENS